MIFDVKHHNIFSGSTTMSIDVKSVMFLKSVYLKSMIGGVAWLHNQHLTCALFNMTSSRGSCGFRPPEAEATNYDHSFDIYSTG
jgi:hypothetical protein